MRHARNAGKNDVTEGVCRMDNNKNNEYQQLAGKNVFSFLGKCSKINAWSDLKIGYTIFGEIIL